MSVKRSVVVIMSLLGLSVLLLLWPVPLQFLTSNLSAMGLWGYVAYVLLLASAVVFAPVTVMPLIPLATTVFGPLITGVLSVIGWTFGSVIAFVIARRYGRPLLELVLPIEKIDAVTTQFPSQAQFVSIFLLRHIVPVDVLSYALGLVPSVRFSTYFLATLLGVSWFSFAFAYLGDALFTGNLWILLELGLASLAVCVVAWYMFRRNKSNKN